MGEIQEIEKTAKSAEAEVAGFFEAQYLRVLGFIKSFGHRVVTAQEGGPDAMAVADLHVEIDRHADLSFADKAVLHTAVANAVHQPGATAAPMDREVLAVARTTASAPELTALKFPRNSPAPAGTLPGGAAAEATPAPGQAQAAPAQAPAQPESEAGSTAGSTAEQ